MVWLELKKMKVLQYSTCNEPNGEKRISSGKVESNELEELKDKEVLIRIKKTDIKFFAYVKTKKNGKYEIPYISSKLLKEFVGKEINFDMIEVEK